MTRWYATRSAVQAPSDDFTAQMQHEQFGPYPTRDDAYDLVHKVFTAKLAQSLSKDATRIQAMFASQYAGLLAEMNQNPTRNQFDHDGVRWTLRSV